MPLNSAKYIYLQQNYKTLFINNLCRDYAATRRAHKNIKKHIKIRDLIHWRCREELCYIFNVILWQLEQHCYDIMSKFPNTPLFIFNSSSSDLWVRLLIFLLL